MNFRIVFAITGIVLLALQANPLNAQAPTYTNLVKPGKFERLMKKKNTVILDVRTTEEYKGSHLPGAMHLSIKDTVGFVTRVNTFDKTKRYLLYCGTNRRSQAALDIMKKQGFGNVFHLRGGIENWRGKLE